MKGEERPIFGWGGFSRERVYDDETGKDLVIQDGYWIAWYGTHGMLGFICFFAMLLWPIYQVARNIHRISGRADRIMLAGLAYIVVICGVNMLPNMTLPNLQFFFAGGLATLMKELLKQAAFEAKQSAKGGAKVPSAPPNGLRHAG
jgi:hypothetical protein